MTECTDQQLQAYRDWAAVEIMGYTILEGYAAYYKPRGLGLVIAYEFGDWLPDKDANQRDMMMGNFKLIDISKAKGIWTVKLYPEDIGNSKTYDKSLGLACLVACCKASGMEIEQ